MPAEVLMLLMCSGECVTALPRFVLDFFSGVLSYSEFVKNNKLVFSGRLTCVMLASMPVSRASVGFSTVTVKHIQMQSK